MSRFETQRAFLEADRKTGQKVVGADVTIVVKGYEGISFLVKTSGLPMLKNAETVEYSTTHGVKTVQDGYLQTLNEISISFMENDALNAKHFVETILLEDKNGDIEIDFYIGRTIEDTSHWGTLKYAVITSDDNPEGDSESTTTPLAISIVAKGHYFPSKLSGVTTTLKTALNLTK